MPHFDLVGLVKWAGYVGVFAIIFAETGLLVGFFLPGDSLLFTAGVLASQGLLDIWLLAPICFVAAVLGDAVGYTFGQRVGRNLFNRPESLLFKKENLVKAERFFERHGGKAVMLARFLPFARTFTPIIAGIGAMRYRYFVIYNVIGALLWAVAVTVAGYYLGSTIPADSVDRYLIPIVLLILFVSVLPTAIHLWRQNGPQISAALRRQLKR